MYKQASRLKLRFDIVGAGRLSTEQLFSANMEGLINAEEELQAAVEKLGITSRRKHTQTKAGEELKLKLAIVSDVLDTLEKENADRQTAAAKKENNQKIVNLIAMKKEEELGSKTIEELEALLQ